MSVKLMSAIFETEFFDLPMPEPDKNGKPRRAKASSLKLVLLALADHANDEGESSYPGLTKLMRKTALSRQGLVDVLSAIKYNGLAVVADEPSKLGTNNYTINLQSFPRLADQEGERLLVKSLDQSSHLTGDSQATLPEPVKPLDRNHPLTTIQPPVPVANIFKVYESNIGMLTAIQADRLKDAENEYPNEWIVDAIKEAVIHNKRNWAYCEAILKRWKANGRDSGKEKPVTEKPYYVPQPIVQASPEFVAKQPRPRVKRS